MDLLQTRAAIAAMGRELSPQILADTRGLFAGEQVELARASPAAAAVDCAYGPDLRQTLDLYRPASGRAPFPILVWVHGGGFIRGEKSSADHPFEAHVGRLAARNGYLGAVINYRLAPKHTWPAGGEDVGAAVDWLRKHAAEHGGDPERIILAGTSAGAVHLATYLQLRPDRDEVRGMVLLSGLYGFTPLSERDQLYFGSGDGRMPREAVSGTRIPLLVACAEFDPPRFQTEFAGLLQARLRVHGRLPEAYIASGHNHFSLGVHLGGTDRRFTDEFLRFAAEQSRR